MLRGVVDDIRVEVEGVKERGREDSVEVFLRSREDIYFVFSGRVWEKEIFFF